MADRRGFTLLEVVVALTALALVAGVCYGAFHLAVRAMERGEVAVVTAQRLRVMSDTLRQIRSALSHRELDADLNPYQFFRGTAKSLTFDTNLQLQGGGGVSRVTYEVLDDPPRLRLTESEPPQRHGKHAKHRRREVEAPRNARSAILLEGFRSLTFEYIDFEGQHFSTWDPEAVSMGESDLEQEGLPAFVSVRIEGVPGIEGGTWQQDVPIVIATMNESVNEDGASALDELLETDDDGGVDEEDEDDDEATPAASHQNVPPQPPRGQSFTKDDLEEDE
jgi:prepilin-type N-terminal cleavage/methylation domain-containing protein